MYTLEIEELPDNGKDVSFKGPCGHTNTFKYSAPTICQNVDCNKSLPSVDKLIGSFNQDNRVKFFAESDI